MIKYFLIRNFRGTCLTVEMLKGYMFRERFSTVCIYISQKLQHKKAKASAKRHEKLDRTESAEQACHLLSRVMYRAANYLRALRDPTALKNTKQRVGISPLRAHSSPTQERSHQKCNIFIDLHLKNLQS